MRHSSKSPKQQPLPSLFSINPSSMPTTIEIYSVLCPQPSIPLDSANSRYFLACFSLFSYFSGFRAIVLHYGYFTVYQHESTKKAWVPTKEYILVRERTATPCVFQTFAHPTSPIEEEPLLTALRSRSYLPPLPSGAHVMWPLAAKLTCACVFSLVETPR